MVVTVGPKIYNLREQHSDISFHHNLTLKNRHGYAVFSGMEEIMV